MSPYHSPSSNVRFAPTVQEAPIRYATSTYSSPRSSVSPMQPPSLGRTVTALPPMGCSIHPAMDADRLASVISWNAIDMPRPNALFDEPATHPTLPYIDLHVKHLPWSFRVEPLQKPYVTIGDVFRVLYEQLRAPLSERRSKESFPHSQDMIKQAFRERVHYTSKSSPEAYSAEYNKGVKRVDCLGSHVRFAGLSHPKTNGDPHAFDVRFT